MPKPEHYDAAVEDSSLGVGHWWMNVGCPAYLTMDPADCTCSDLIHETKGDTE